MLGMSVGSMVGHLATRAFGTHDLPIPRQPEHGDAGPVATSTRSPASGRSRVDEMRLWVLAHELAGAHPVPGRRTCAEALSDLVRRHVGGFRPDPSAVADRLGVARRRAEPIRSPRSSRRSAIPSCSSAPSRRPSSRRCGRSSTPSSPSSSATPTGSSTRWRCASWAATPCASPRPSAAGGSRPSASDSFVEQLLGIRLGDEQVARGKAFAQGRGRPRRRRTGCVPLLERPDARARRPARSTPPASGSPASRDSRSLNRPIWSPRFSISRTWVTRSGFETQSDQMAAG